ncbi:MAG: hypothetical protein J3K34DRAFT_469869 [Monoraphidium minutum]|nr:MAG: hypothetical protein J3K34DRAFT_469869 [Monoraphidium minutum]
MVCIKGAVHHLLGPLMPAAGQPAQFAQLYIIDNEADMLMARLRAAGDVAGHMNDELLADLQQMLLDNSKYVRDFRQIDDREITITTDGKVDKRRCNPQRAPEVAGVMPVQGQTLAKAGSGGEDPHLKGFHGQAYEFCAAGKAECRGLVFSLASEQRLQVNAEVGALSGTAGLRSLLAAARVNGEDVLGKVGSGDTLEVAAGTRVHFPAATHAADSTDGPVMVVVTPATTWTWYLESEDTWHLDFKVAINVGSGIKQMHGLLGQSLHWDPSAPAAVEGSDDMLYVVPDGLLGTDTKFGLFGKPAAAVALGVRRALSAAAAGGLAAGSAAALALA